MTRKRFIKLMMARGNDRNTSERMASKCNQMGLSYKFVYDIIVTFTDNARAVFERIREMLDNMANKFVKAFEAVVDSFQSAFSPEGISQGEIK